MGSPPSRKSLSQLAFCSCIFVGHFIHGVTYGSNKVEEKDRELTVVDDVNCPETPGMFDMIDSAVSFKVFTLKCI